MKAQQLFETADPMTQHHIPEERNSQLSTLIILSKFVVTELCMLMLVHSQSQLKFSPLFKVRYFLFVHHHHHISVMELGQLLTRSGLTYPEVSSKVCHDSFCQLENSDSLPWVIYCEAFYLHVVSSFSCTPVISPKLVLFLTPL